MKVYFPSYYKDFKCIADRCRHSCCVGWEIDVDDGTVEVYEGLGGELGREIRSHISGGVIAMCFDGRCPFLDSRGLCRIISSLGEEYVSDICREHPRFYHSVGGRIEGGIGISCEEAARIVLSSDGYADFIDISCDIDTPAPSDFDVTEDRKYIFSMLRRDDGYQKKVDRILRHYSLPDPCDRVEEWNEILSELEYLDGSRVGSLTVGRKIADTDAGIYASRYLAYLIFRHVSLSASYDNMRARIGFSILLSRIFENLVARGCISFDEVCDAARIISREIEYSEDNTASLIFEFESEI